MSVREDLVKFASKRHLNATSLDDDELSAGDVSTDETMSKASASVMSGSVSLSGSVLRPSDEKARYRLEAAATKPGAQQVSGGGATKPGAEQVTHSQVHREFASLGLGKFKPSDSPTEESKEEITEDTPEDRMAWHSNSHDQADGITMKEMQMGAQVTPAGNVDMLDATSVDPAQQKVDGEVDVDIEKGGNQAGQGEGGQFDYAEMSMDNLIEAHIVEESAELNGSIVQGVAIDLKGETRRKRLVSYMWPRSCTIGVARERA